MIQIELHKTWAYCAADEGSERRIYEWCKVRPKGYQWNEAYRRRRWDGFVRFYDRQRHSFPAGLLEYLLARMAHEGVACTLIDARGKAPTLDWKRRLKGLVLRGYQQEAVQAILHHEVETGDGPLFWPRGYIEMATAGGKTPILAALAAAITPRVLVLTHTKELLHQTAEEFERMLGERVGRLGGGHTDTGQRVTVGIMQAVSRNLAALREFLGQQAALLVDEVHHVGSAKTFLQVVHACPAYIRVGVSGTPTREDDPAQILQLQGALGAGLYTLPASELIDMGIVAPVTVYFVPVRGPRKLIQGVPSWRLPYLPKEVLYHGQKFTMPGAYDELIVKNEERNAEFVAFATSRDAPTLVLVERHEHGQALAQAMECKYVSGLEKDSERRAIVKGMQQGRIVRLVASTIWDEGVNVPRIRYLALAGGGKAPHRLKQRVGRGMRKEKAEDELIVMDAYDYTHKDLMKHSRQRMMTGFDAGYQIDECEHGGDVPLHEHRP